jgi:hypothetical protein
MLVGSLMAEHRFRVGDLVRVGAGVDAKPDKSSFAAGSCNHPSGIHEVTRLLPSMGSGEPQYLIKGCSGQPERNIGESQLTSAVHFPQPRR